MKTTVQDALKNPEAFAAQYDRIVYDLAKQWIPSIPLLPREKVLDVGSRHGRVAGLLAYANPETQFHGITTAGYMEVIQKNPVLELLPNLTFEQQDLKTFSFQNRFDKIVSFGCLTWIEDKKPALASMFASLKPGHKAYLQLFVDHGQQWFDRCVFAVAAKPQWKGYFTDFKKKCKHCKPGEFIHFAEEVGFIPVKADLHTRKVEVASEDYFKNWMIGWSSHTRYLPEDKIDAFFSEVVETRLQMAPKDAEGRIFYEDIFFEVELLKPAE